MITETRILIQYRLDRTRQALAEAALLLDSNHANTGVNRLYYACFYAVSALLLTKGLTATRHSGLRTLFHQHLIRPGLLPPDQGSSTIACLINGNAVIMRTWSILISTKSVPGMERHRSSSKLPRC
jgi:hypothetical protein